MSYTVTRAFTYCMSHFNHKLFNLLNYYFNSAGNYKPLCFILTGNCVNKLRDLKDKHDF